MNLHTAPPSTPAGLASIEAVTAALAGCGYIATRQISTAVYLAHHLRKPVLIEGPAGVGKTELAVSCARALDFSLIRLQCYEGLDDSRALYEWKYGKQLLYTQILKEKIGLLIDSADSLSAAFGKLASLPNAADNESAESISRPIFSFRICVYSSCLPYFHSYSARLSSRPS